MNPTATYKIISTRQSLETVYTLVEYNYDGEVVTVEIAHFAPQTVADIEQGILNRGVTELQRLQYLKSIGQVLTSLELNVEKPI